MKKQGTNRSNWPRTVLGASRAAGLGESRNRESALRDAPRKTRNRTISKRPRILPVSSHVLQRTMAIGRVWFAERSEIPLPDLRASNNGRRSFSGDGGFDGKDRPLETAFHSRNSPRLVSGAKPRSPKGSSRPAEGASPGFKGDVTASAGRREHGGRATI